MKIVVGSDHAGFVLKQEIAEMLRNDGHEVVDAGTHSTAPVDYPDSAAAVGRAVVSGQAERGVLICGSGVGASVAANVCTCRTSTLVGKERISLMKLRGWSNR